MPEQSAPFEGWTILELMGHRRLGGYIREINVAGAGFLQIDIPDVEGDKPYATQIYSPSSVYCMTPTTEAMARAVATSNRPQPVARWELPAAPETAAGSPLPDGGDDDPGDDPGTDEESEF